MSITEVFVLRAPEGFEWLQPADPENYDLFRFDGTSRANSWSVVRMTRLKRSEKGRKEKPTDFPFGTNQLILSPRAYVGLRTVLESHGELLPLVDDDGGRWWVFNATRIVSALDTERSQLSRSPDDPSKILIIVEHSLKKEQVEKSGAEVFKLAEMPHGKTYFTGRFVERVRDLGLVGADFVHPR